MRMISTLSTLVLAAAALTSSACVSRATPAVAPASAACHQIPDPLTAASAFYEPGAIDAPKTIEFSYARQDWAGEVIGAEIFVRASRGTTPEYLQRALMCHANGSGPAASPNDPLRPAGGLMEVRVRSAGHGYLVSLFGNGPNSAKDTIERARAMAGNSSDETVKLRQVSQNDALPHP